MFSESLSHYTSNKTQDLIISKRILNGEPELFVLLLKPYNKTLYYAVRSIVNPEDLIRKAILVSYANAFKNLNWFYGQCSFKIWLLSIGIREAKRLATQRNGNTEVKSLSNEVVDILPEYPR